MDEKNWKWPLSLLVYHAERAMNADLNRRLQQADIPLKIEHWPVLKALLVKDGQTQQELADAVCKDKATLTRTVDALEKNGLVKRRFDADDRRKRLVYVTDKGFSYRMAIKAVFDQHKQNMLEDVEEQKIDHAIEVMQVIIKKLSGQEVWNSMEEVMKKMQQSTKKHEK